VGCWVMAVILFLLDVCLVVGATLMSVRSHFGSAALTCLVALICGWGGMIFRRAALDISEDFRCHVLPAIYFLILLLGFVAFLACAFLSESSETASPTGVDLVIIGSAFFLVPVILLAALLWVLLTIMRQWKTRNHRVNA